MSHVCICGFRRLLQPRLLIPVFRPNVFNGCCDTTDKQEGRRNSVEAWSPVDLSKEFCIQACIETSLTYPAIQLDSRDSLLTDDWAARWSVGLVWDRVWRCLGMRLLQTSRRLSEGMPSLSQQQQQQQELRHVGLIFNVPSEQYNRYTRIFVLDLWHFWHIPYLPGPAVESCFAALRQIRSMQRSLSNDTLCRWLSVLCCCPPSAIGPFLLLLTVLETVPQHVMSAPSMFVFWGRPEACHSRRSFPWLSPQHL